tara:strand:+ start:61 stop:1602 length:1542 start_codon:yes stop_codon:yes gene_type:complete
MYYPGAHAHSRPDQPAVIIAGTDQRITHKAMDERSNRIAQLLHDRGFRPGDHVAILMENNLRYFEIFWAALRSGLIFTPINRYFTPDEVAYVVNDSGAKALFTSTYMRETAEALLDRIPECSVLLSVDGVCSGYDDLDTALVPFPTTPLANEPRGQMMLYSSGTTGRPKGILRTPVPADISEGLSHIERLRDYGIDGDTIYLSPAPIYHAAPLAYSVGVLSLGGTVVMMPRFDAELALRHIQDYRVTHSQWVPTMFIRMLKLSDEARSAYDLSSHQVAIHAAAPCPVEIKRQVIDWWGPILHEYYAGSESNGSTRIDSQEWLKRPGSVGKASMGVLHICDEDGNEVAPGSEGIIYFEQPEMPFRYHNDPDKTREAQNPKHTSWSTLGDVGYVDEDGYLYLTDRKSFMIISGGVNIYPQAIEDALVLHPSVTDAAVIGVPNEDFGEEVKAVVQLEPGIPESAALAEDLIGFTRDKVASYMVPRSLDFTDALPRLPTGKLYKHKLREKYWPAKPR